MNYGYARVSTDDQTPALQLQALKAAGCTRVFKDEGKSGATLKRPQLTRCLKTLQAGDTLTVWKLDRLGRSLRDLLNLLHEFEQRGIHFRSLTEHIDTATPAGRMLMQMLGAFAEFERGLLRERTRAGIAAAKRRGVTVGRRRKLTAKQVRHARSLIEQGEKAQDVADSLGVGRATLYRALRVTELPR